MRMLKWVPMIAVALALAGCGSKAAVDDTVIDNAATKVASEADRVGDKVENALDPAIDAAATDAWIGHWTGPEGLYLDIVRDPDGGAGHYVLNMQFGTDPADSGVYKGEADGGTIKFFRQADGAQTLTHTDGLGTGMKWLATKQDCLTVKAGEAYCRG